MSQENLKLQPFTKPLEVQNGDSVYCPYIKADNIFKNISGVPTPQTLLGSPVEKICLPNLSDRNPPLGYGKNVCKSNSPYHISFFGGLNDCYLDSICSQKLETCYDPLSEQ